MDNKKTIDSNKVVKNPAAAVVVKSSKAKPKKMVELQRPTSFTIHF